MSARPRCSIWPEAIRSAREKKPWKRCGKRSARSSSTASTTLCCSIRLAQEQLNKIVDLELAKVMRLLAERNVRIELTPAARERIVHDGYDPAYGARPLRRTVQRLVQDPLAMRILDGSVLPGDLVRVDVDPRFGFDAIRARGRKSRRRRPRQRCKPRGPGQVPRSPAAASERFGRARRLVDAPGASLYTELSELIR